LTAVDYPTQELDLVETGHLEAPSLPTITPFAQDRPRHHPRLYGDGDQLAVPVGKLAVPRGASGPLSEELMTRASGEGVGEITILSGVPFAHGPDQYEPFYAATEDYAATRLEDVGPWKPSTRRSASTTRNWWRGSNRSGTTNGRTTGCLCNDRSLTVWVDIAGQECTTGTIKQLVNRYLTVHELAFGDDKYRLTMHADECTGTATGRRWPQVDALLSELWVRESRRRELDRPGRRGRPRLRLPGLSRDGRDPVSPPRFSTRRSVRP
jgi:hypothetical protein